MAAAPESITIKLVLDVEETNAKLNDAFRKVAAGMRAAWNVEFPPPKPKTVFPMPHISGYAVEIARQLDGRRISPEDAEYLISCISSRTY